MKYRLILFGLVVSIQFSTAQTVDLTQSNLPIFIINTNGLEILPSAKINVNLQIIDNGTGLNLITDPPTVYDGLIGIEKRGSSSAWVSDKSPYSIELRNDLGQDSAVSILGLTKESDFALIAPYSDKTLIRDMLTYSWGSNMMAWAPGTRPCELVVNGEYRGMYVLTERIKRDQGRVNISKLTTTDLTGDQLTGGYIFKIDKCDGEAGCLEFNSAFTAKGSNAQIRYQPHSPNAEDIKPEQWDFLKSFIQTAEISLFSQGFMDSITGYRKYFDVNSFVDFFLINEITKNVDGYRISAFYYKDRDSVDSRWHAGPIWDFNIALGNANYCGGGDAKGWAYQFNYLCQDDYWQVPPTWDRLLDDPYYRLKVKARWLEMRGGTWHLDSIFAQIDGYADLLNDVEQRNFDRWPIHGTYVWPNPYAGVTYEQDIDYLKDWLSDRIYWLDGQFERFDQIKNVNEDQIGIIYPNPITINSPINVFGYEYGTATWLDIAGKELATQPTETIIAPKEAGIYILMLRSPFKTDKPTAQRVIVLGDKL
jgi:CotH kinase protein